MTVDAEPSGPKVSHIARTDFAGSPNVAGPPVFAAVMVAARRFAARLFAARLFASVRTRLAILMALSALPVLLLAGTIAAQNYTMARARSLDEVRLLREAAVARQAAALQAATQVLRAIAADAGLRHADPVACAQDLAAMARLLGPAYANLIDYDANGAVRCSARPGAPTISPAQVRAAAPSGTPGRFRQDPGADGASSMVLPIMLPIAATPDGPPATGVGAGRILVADLRVNWFTDATQDPNGSPLEAIWLIDGQGGSLPLGAATQADLPAAARLRGAAFSGAVLARCAHGPEFAYAAAELAGGIRLLVGYPASHNNRLARRELAGNLLLSLLLLVVAPGAVALGAQAALVAPLQRLSRAVARWRVGGCFDETVVAGSPAELRSLAHTFAIATADLASQEGRLRAARDQQILLMKEIHHRVKNNLQIVASLLNLQAARIRAPEAKAEFASARDRVRALATLHRHLYATDNDEASDRHLIAMPAFLTELCGQLFQAMGEREGRRIALTIEAVPIELQSDQAVPLALIVTETVSNALKYAFPDGRTGRILVRLAREPDAIVLVIEDDGVGIRPPEQGGQGDPARRAGLGMQLVRGFAKQLGAELILREEPGTRLVLRMSGTGWDT